MPRTKQWKYCLVQERERERGQITDSATVNHVSRVALHHSTPWQTGQDKLREHSMGCWKIISEGKDNYRLTIKQEIFELMC